MSKMKRAGEFHVSYNSVLYYHRTQVQISVIVPVGLATDEFPHERVEIDQASLLQESVGVVNAEKDVGSIRRRNHRVSWYLPFPGSVSMRWFDPLRLHLHLIEKEHAQEQDL